MFLNEEHHGPVNGPIVSNLYFFFFFNYLLIIDLALTGWTVYICRALKEVKLCLDSETCQRQLVIS